MSSLRALAGEYVDLELDRERRTVKLRVDVPFHDFDALLKGIGLPPRPSERDAIGAGPSVLLVGLPRAGTPTPAVAAAALGAAGFLTTLFDAHRLGRAPDPALLEALRGLFNAAEAAWQAPIEPARWAPAYRTPPEDPAPPPPTEDAP